MATAGILRSRRSAAQLHALASVEREIRANDHAGGRKYIRDFRNAYRTYSRILSCSEVDVAIANCGTVLVGDYHALPNSQRYFASLLENPDLKGRPIVVGLETVFSRDQRILEEWLHGEIGERELRQRIRFDPDWGYDWAPTYELLKTARTHATAVYGLDCMPREDLRKIRARDRHAASKIAGIRARHPEALILVLFGESHLAPNHLPALVRENLPEERLLTILQNVDALYWRAAGERSDQIEAVEVEPDVLGVFNATPLEKYENYRLCLNRWSQERSAPPDLGPTVYNLIDGLARLLGIKRYSPHNTTQPQLLVDLMPEIYSKGSDTLLRRLLSRKGVSPERRDAIVSRVKERGSIYLPALNTVYIDKFHMDQAAEDAACFLHHACRGLPGLVGKEGPSSAEDSFYTSVLEQALGYFGSRVLYPARAAFRDRDIYELYDLTSEDLQLQTSMLHSEAVASIDYLALHREFFRTAIIPDTDPEWISQGFLFTGKKRDFVIEHLGLLLGNDLYDGYLEGRLTPTAIRKFFLTHTEVPGAARKTYYELNIRLRQE